MAKIEMKPPAEDLAFRRVVWQSLSELFLDTELDDVWLRGIAAELFASPYTWEEAERILWEEVYPVCIWNLRTVAGEWMMFDPEWLETNILAYCKRRFRLPVRFQTGHWMIEEEWKSVQTHFFALHKDSTAQ